MIGLLPHRYYIHYVHLDAVDDVAAGFTPVERHPQYTDNLLVLNIQTSISFFCICSTWQRVVKKTNTTAAEPCIIGARYKFVRQRCKYANVAFTCLERAEDRARDLLRDTERLFALCGQDGSCC